MTTPYYTGDTVPLRFTVTDANGAVNPSSCVVVILKPNRTVTSETDAVIDGNEVSYNVLASVTNVSGVYKAFFVLTLAYGERTHKIEFNVTKNAG